VALQLIRLFDHPFIPLSFHWRTCVIRANHENAASPAVFINHHRAHKKPIPTYEIKVISIQKRVIIQPVNGTGCPDENLNTLTAGYFET